MEMTRDLLKETRDTKATFHAKMYTIKDRNGMDLTEAKVLIQMFTQAKQMFNPLKKQGRKCGKLADACPG